MHSLGTKYMPLEEIIVLIQYVIRFCPEEILNPVTMKVQNFVFWDEHESWWVSYHCSMLKWALRLASDVIIVNVLTEYS